MSDYSNELLPPCGGGKYVHRLVVDTLCDLLSSHYNEDENGGVLCEVFNEMIKGIKYEVNHL